MQHLGSDDEQGEGHFSSDMSHDSSLLADCPPPPLLRGPPVLSLDRKASGVVSGRSVMIHGGDITNHIGKDHTNVSYLNAPNFESFSTSPMKKFVCGVMNAGMGGAMYIGVDRSGIVRGINIGRKQVCCIFFVMLTIMRDCFIPEGLSQCWSGCIDDLCLQAAYPVGPVQDHIPPYCSSCRLHKVQRAGNNR